MDYIKRRNINENNKRIGLREVILITLLTGLCIGVQTVVLIPFAANLKLVLWLVSGIDLVLCGTIFVLMIGKSPNQGTLLLYSFIFSIYFFFTNGMIAISMMTIALGLISEIILLGGGYRSKIKVTICYILFGVGVMLAPNILILMQKDTMVQTMLSSGLTQEYIDTMFSIYSLGNIGIGVVITIIGGIIGAAIGYKVLQKYFVSSGMVKE